MWATSSRQRWKWSPATSPVSPPSVRPGVWEKVSQIETPRPPSVTPPSIW